MDEMLGPLRMVFAELQDKIKEASEEQPLWDVIMGFVHAINWRVSDSNGQRGLGSILQPGSWTATFPASLACYAFEYYIDLLLS